MTNDRRWFSPPLYGLPNYADLFTSRQLTALTTFSDLVAQARDEVQRDAIRIGMSTGGLGLDGGGLGAAAYADAVATYLAFAVDKAADSSTTLCAWQSNMDRMRSTFARHALPMTWDYVETNPMAGAGGDLQGTVTSLCEVLDKTVGGPQGKAHQHDVTLVQSEVTGHIISTDPPYYDNIGYADLSDFFYVWLRRSLAAIYPQLFTTLLTPKERELIAAAARHDGSKEKARNFFEGGLGKAFSSLIAVHNKEYPLSVFYAFKQTESEDDLAEEADFADEAVSVSTGWETMLDGLLKAGFIVTGTWPVRSELGNRNIARGTNALASSIVLVCRPRAAEAATATRKEFITALRTDLPDALRNLQRGNIAPVDLAQASIGPGMAVFTRYAKVIESDGSPMRVRTALQLINQALDEVLTEQEGEFDADTRWALAWFEQYGMAEGPYGTAETLSKAKNTGVNALAQAGLVVARGGKVRLVKRDELPPDWTPLADGGAPVWEATQHLIRALDQLGESGAADLLRKLGTTAETARDLAYRLYTLCERKKWAEEALAYNTLVIAWPELLKLALAARAASPSEQKGLFE
jgi:putative DNA methylase